MRLSKSLVRSKCQSILADTRRIQAILKQFPYEHLVTNEEQMTLCERYLERVVNRAIDVNYHLIRAAGEATPADYTDSFFLLGKIKVIPAKLAVAIAPSAGARNILVHEYDDIDARLFFSALQSCVKQYPQYVGSVERYLEKKK